MNYTKGEWKVKQKKPTEANFFDGFILLVEDEKLLIALCDREGWDNHKERLANANLIAAAPAMYEALKVIRGWLQDNVEKVGIDCTESDMLKEIMPALAKAEGEDPQ